MIELAKFVEETLVQLVEGVFAGNSRVQGLGGIVNPYVEDTTGGSESYTGHDGGRFGRGVPIRSVKFDVAVTSVEEKGENIKAGIFVAPFGVAGGKTTDLSNSTVSRIQFEVPLALPVGDKR